jgi:hypothetical protein
MLRLTTLPIPNHPGTLFTQPIQRRDVINMIREAVDKAACVSHIGYADTHDDMEQLAKVPIPKGGRYLPKQQPGDRFVTIRREPGESIDRAEFLLTIFRETR